MGVIELISRKRWICTSAILSLAAVGAPAVFPTGANDIDIKLPRFPSGKCIIKAINIWGRVQYVSGNSGPIDSYLLVMVGQDLPDLYSDPSGFRMRMSCDTRGKVDSDIVIKLAPDTDFTTINVAALMRSALAVGDTAQIVLTLEVVEFVENNFS